MEGLHLTMHLESYNWAMSIRDPRVADWLLMSSPAPTLLLCLVYIVGVRTGLQFMEGKEAWSIQRPIQVYNVIMVAINLHVAVELIRCFYEMESFQLCLDVDYSSSSWALKVAAALWWHYVSKSFEFFDTVSMVLRKKTRQVTFLHVFHHSTMFPIWWLGVAYVAGGNSMIGATINSIIHVIMYSYYFLAALGPSYKKYLWWKKYLTTLQMLQFVVVLSHAVYAIHEVNNHRCKFPLWMGYCNIAYMILMVVLFSLFWLATYSKTNDRYDTNTKKK